MSVTKHRENNPTSPRVLFRQTEWACHKKRVSRDHEIQGILATSKPCIFLANLTNGEENTIGIDSTQNQWGAFVMVSAKSVH